MQHQLPASPRHRALDGRRHRLALLCLAPRAHSGMWSDARATIASSHLHTHRKTNQNYGRVSKHVCKKNATTVCSITLFVLLLFSLPSAHPGPQSLTLIAPAGMLDSWQFDLLRPLRCLYPCFRAILLAINSRPAGRDLCKARVRWRQ